MIGIVVASHAHMAQGLIEAAEMILGPLKGVEALAVEQHDGPAEIRERFAAAIERLDSGDGVLVLTDMFGGTPCNVGLSFMGGARVEVLTGVNLPMLLKACNARSDSPLQQVAGELRDFALTSIVLVSQLIKDQGTAR